MPRSFRALWMFAFIAVFLIATHSVSQLTSLAPRMLRGTAYLGDALVGIGYFAITVLSVLILARMIYSSELASGRVKRRVRFLE